MKPLLHVTNGDSAGDTLRRTALGGAVLPWRDTLHEGPVPALPRRELLETRAAFDAPFLGDTWFLRALGELGRVHVAVGCRRAEAVVFAMMVA